MTASATHPHGAIAYLGPWPIRTHRTLADLGYGEPVLIGFYSGHDFAPSGPVVEGTCSVVAHDREGREGLAGTRPAAPVREDPRDLQRAWDHEEQFRVLNAAFRGPGPDGETPRIMALALAIGSAAAGAAMIMGVVTLMAVLVGIVGGVH